MVESSLRSLWIMTFWSRRELGTLIFEIRFRRVVFGSIGGLRVIF